MKREFYICTGVWTKKGDKIKYISSLNVKQKSFATSDSPINAKIYRKKETALRWANWLKLNFSPNFWTDYAF